MLFYLLVVLSIQRKTERQGKWTGIQLFQELRCICLIGIKGKKNVREKKEKKKRK